MREKDPSKLEKVGEFSVVCQYTAQVALFKKCYPGDAKLTAWPYGITLTKYILSINVYGEYCKLKIRRKQ